MEKENDKKEVKKYDIDPKLYKNLYFPKDYIKKLEDLKENMMKTIDVCINQIAYIDSQIQEIIKQCCICDKCIYGLSYEFDREGKPTIRVCIATNEASKERHQMILDASKNFECLYFEKGYEYFKDMKSKHMNIFDYMKIIPVEERHKIDAHEYHETPVGRCNSVDDRCSFRKDDFCFRNHYPEKRCSSVETFPGYNEEWNERWMNDRRKEKEKREGKNES